MSDKLKDVCWYCLRCNGDDLRNYKCQECEICGNKVYPSWSNIKWHLPIIKHITKLCFNINWRYQLWRENKEYISLTETKELKHIWGVKSWDDLSPSNETNLYTMNDFDLLYNKNTNKYVLGVETIYSFSTEDGDKKYIKYIFDKFTEWMKENEYNTEYSLSLYEVFTLGFNINTEYETVEQAYATFKFLTKGYDAL